MAFAYDAEGRRTRRTVIATGASVEYAWDHRGRLTEVSHRTAAGLLTRRAAYAYDALDRRVAKQVDADGDGSFDAAEHWAYDAAGKEDGNGIGGLDDAVLAFAAGSLATRYLHGPAVDQVLAAEALDDAQGASAPGEVSWLLADHLGTLRDEAVYNAVLGETSVVNHLTYDAFGRILTQSSPSRPVHYAFTGREWDADAGLYYYRARWYDAVLGQFVSEDPIGFAAGDGSLRRYVGNAATVLRDPSGYESYGFPPSPYSDELREGAQFDWNAYMSYRDGTYEEKYADRPEIARFNDRLQFGLMNVAKGAIYDPIAPLLDLSAGYFATCGDIGRLLAGKPVASVNDPIIEFSPVPAAIRQARSEGQGWGEIYGGVLLNWGLNTGTAGGYNTFLGFQNYLETGNPTAWQEAAGSQLAFALVLKFGVNGQPVFLRPRGCGGPAPASIPALPVEPPIPPPPRPVQGPAPAPPPSPRPGAGTPPPAPATRGGGTPGPTTGEPACPAQAACPRAPGAVPVPAGARAAGAVNPWESLPLRSNSYGNTEGAAGSFVNQRLQLSRQTPNGLYKFVLDSEGRIWLASVAEEVPHSALVPRGDPVRCAGYINVRDGRANLNGRSGHYMKDSPVLESQVGAYQQAVGDTVRLHGIEPVSIDPGMGGGTLAEP